MINSFKDKRNVQIILAVVLVLAVLLTVGGIFAKYRVEYTKKAEMIAHDFHISSNYLEPSGSKVSLYATDWQDGIKLELYNFEKENVELKSSTDITYKIDFPKDFDVVVTKISSNTTVTIVPNSKGEYVLERIDGMDSIHSILVKPKTGATISSDEKIDISIEAVSPFAKELTGEVFLADSNEIEYTVERVKSNGDYYLLTLKTNHFSGDLNISWPQDLVVDNTNEKMLNWRGNSGVFVQAESFYTYELIFFNPAEKSFNKSDFSVAVVE